MGRIFYRDIIDRRVIAELNRVPWPVPRDTRIDAERLTAQAKAEHPFQTGPIEPAGRTAVPGPSSAPDVGGLGIHVAGDHVGLDFVALDVRSRGNAMDRIQEAEQLAGLVSITKRRERQHGPDGRMSVLAAVFANTRDIAFDIPGILRHPVEGWRQQAYQPVLPVHQMLVHRRHGACAAARVGGATDHAPGLRNRINAALRICSGPQRCPVIKKRTAIPFSVPPVPLDRGLQCADMEPPRFRATMLAALSRYLGKLPEHRMQKPAEPHAFTLALLPDTVHPVIPVSSAHERKTMTPDGQAPVQHVRTMFKEGGALLGHSRLKIGLMLSLHQRRTF